MATNSGVRISKNTLSRAITLYKDAIPEATQDGVEEAMQAGAAAMAQVLTRALSYHGVTTHPQNPGRIDTGELLQSFWDNGEAAEAYRVNYNRNGNLHAEFGILDGPSYAVYQELGTGNQGGAIAGGGSGGIVPMHAVQAGFNVVASRIMDDIAAQLSVAGRDAEAGRLYRRAAKQRRA